MELKERVETARLRFEDLHDNWRMGNFGEANKEEFEWLKTDIQLMQAEALMRLAYKSW